MKLSEAVLLGLPEIHFTNSHWYQYRERGRCSGCLVGAALYAVGVKDVQISGHRLIEKYWSWVRSGRGFRSCPVCEETFHGGPFRYTLTHLADHYAAGTISAERIADLIRAIEPAEEETPVAAEEPRVLAAK